MNTIEILLTVSKLVYKNVRDLAGTAEAASEILGEELEAISQEI
jgi:hypothetical protein